MNQTQTVEAKTRHVDVVHEVVALEHEGVFLIPVAAHGQHLVGALVDCHDVRFGQLVFFVIHTLNAQVCMHFEQCVAVVILQCVAAFFRFLFLDVGVKRRGFAKVTLFVETRSHELLDLVLGLAHHVGHTFCGLNVAGAVWHDDVFG